MEVEVILSFRPSVLLAFMQVLFTFLFQFKYYLDNLYLSLHMIDELVYLIPNITIV